MMDKVIVLVASTVLLLSPNLITAAASSGLINGHYRSFRSIKAPKGKCEHNNIFTLNVKLGLLVKTGKRYCGLLNVILF